MNEMTQAEKDLFIEVAQLGVACGLDHPYEWYENARIHSTQMMANSEIPAWEQRLTEAFTAFMRGAASCPEEEHQTVEDFQQRVVAWYEWKRKKRTKELQLP